jgi:hypothetical protein
MSLQNFTLKNQAKAELGSLAGSCCCFVAASVATCRFVLQGHGNMLHNM